MNATLVDLADRRLGGLVLAASDEWFAPKERLLDPHPPVFAPDRYSTRGKEMDGWETRRHSPTGSDWAVIRLGAAGVVRHVEVDTTHFRGNAPARCALDGHAADHPAVDDVRSATWLPLSDWVDLRPDHRNTLAVPEGPRVTHVRLRIAPDGGVARLRVHGEPLTDLRAAADRCGSLDVAAIANGALVEAVSEQFFSPAARMLQIGDARDMSDGWETRRRRDDGHDWAVVRLATTALVDRIEIDTTHFIGNHPRACALDAIDATSDGGGQRSLADGDWREVVPTMALGPHARHVVDVDAPHAASHVRLRIQPDGGIARLRVFGRVTEEGWRHAGVRWLDALDEARARAALGGCCAASRWIDRMVARRPFTTFAALRSAADDVWADLAPDDWREAFAAHPRIGDRSGSPRSRREQSGTAGADAGMLDALVDGNQRYEERFGHVFLIDATGRSAAEMLADLERRLDHDPDEELSIAAEQQRRIAQRRLDAMTRPERRQQ